MAPAIAGAGQRLFEGLPPIALTPIHGVISPSGYLVLDYRVGP